MILIFENKIFYDLESETTTQKKNKTIEDEPSID
jgi:hypothetical protein